MKNVQIYVILIALSLCYAGHSEPQPVIQILRATYGAASQQIDVTAKVQSLVQSGQLNVRVGNHLFGTDPAFGKVKTLSVLFSSDGVQYRTDIREGEPLSLATSTVDQPSLVTQTQSTHMEPAAGSAVPVTATSAGVPEGPLTPGTTLWLLQRMSITTKAGVIGILPGSKISVAQDNGPTVIVTDGTRTFEMPRTQLTTDPTIAEQTAAADYASQAALAKGQEESRHKLTEEKNAYWVKEQPTIDQRHKIRGLESRYAALQEQESELQRQIEEAGTPLTTIRGRHISNPASSDLPSLRASLNKVRSAKEGIKRQMDEVQRSYKKQQ